MTSVTM